MSGKTRIPPLALFGALALIAIAAVFAGIALTNRAGGQASKHRVGGSDCETLLYPNVEDAYAFSDLIIVGEVEGDARPREATQDEDSSTFFDDRTIKVSEVLKGEAGDQLVVTYVTARKAFGSKYSADASPIDFHEGDSYVLFLQPGRPGRWVPSGVPAAFAVDGDERLEMGDTCGASVYWGVSTLDELKHRIAGIESDPPTPFGGS